MSLVSALEEMHRCTLEDTRLTQPFVCVALFFDSVVPVGFFVVLNEMKRCSPSLCIVLRVSLQLASGA
jgi:hypothetical protein